MIHFFSEIQKELKLPSVVGGYHLINLDGKALYVEGHKGILSLGQELINFRVKGKIVSVLGEGLSLRALTSSTLSIVGEIKCVEVI